MTDNVPSDQDQPAEVLEDVVDGMPGAGASGAAARPWLLTALAFLVLSTMLGLLAALQLVFPDLVPGVLGYGRVAPAALDLFVFGWLTIGLGGVLLFLVGRLGGSDAAGGRAALASLALLALGALAGTVLVVLGMGDGRPLLEYPLYVDAVILLGMLGVASVVTRTVSQAAGDPGPAGWYPVAATWWLVLMFVLGNIPGVGGVAGAVQVAFFRAGLTGLWLAAAAVGVVYFLVPRIAARPAFAATRLSVLGFWSLAFVWPLTAPATLTYGPVSDWLETVGVVFSIALMVPVLVILTDLALAVRDRWAVAAGDLTLRFVVLGAVLFALFPLVNLMVALKGASAVVQFTDWVGAVDVVLVYGAATLWLAAAVHRVLPELTGRVPSATAVRLHFALTAASLGVWVLALLTAGLVAGWSWVANANETAVPAGGDGWVNTADALEWLRPVSLVAFAVYVVAQLWFAATVAGGRRTGHPTAPLVVGAPPPPSDPELVMLRPLGLGSVRAGAVGMLLLVALFVGVVPALEASAADPTLAADTSRLLAEGSTEARGLEIYVQEGCVACHTQQVRPIVTDVGLGPVSVPGDYAHDALPLLGTVRIGPDLMRAGLADTTGDAAWVAAHLADPREARPFSVMPAYDHLSDDELAAVAAYVTTLR